MTGVFYVNRQEPQTAVSKKRPLAAIAYRISGNSRFYYNNTVITAAKGSVIYIPAGVDFRRKSIPEELIVIHLTCFEEKEKEIRVINNAEMLEPLFRKLSNVWTSKSPSSYNRALQLLYGIFEGLQSIDDSSDNSVPDIIVRGVEMMQQRYTDPSLRISELASACFTSEVYFRSLFLKHFQKTPAQVLAELRFERACDLLCSDLYTQKEAAKLSGFSNVKYFRTAFKKHFGITPSAYVKMQSIDS